MKFIVCCSIGISLHFIINDVILNENNSSMICCYMKPGKAILMKISYHLHFIYFSSLLVNNLPILNTSENPVYKTNESRVALRNDG